MEQVWRVWVSSPTCRWVIPANCASVYEAQHYKLPRVAVEKPPNRDYWKLLLESFPLKAGDAAKLYLQMRYKNVSQAVLVASSLVQLALVETEWKPFYIPHLGQPITFEMAAALRGMDAEARDSHIERLLTEAATGGATAPGLERLRQILERVFLYPGFYARLPDEMDATSDLWQLRTSHVP